MLNVSRFVLPTLSVGGSVTMITATVCCMFFGQIADVICFATVTGLQIYRSYLDVNSLIKVK